MQLSVYTAAAAAAPALARMAAERGGGCAWEVGGSARLAARLARQATSKQRLLCPAAVPCANLPARQAEHPAGGAVPDPHPQGAHEERRVQGDEPPGKGEACGRVVVCALRHPSVRLQQSFLMSLRLARPYRIPIGGVPYSGTTHAGGYAHTECMHAEYR
jgi:hypothetical protein